jgi:hypothetical protein
MCIFHPCFDFCAFNSDQSINTADVKASFPVLNDKDPGFSPGRDLHSAKVQGSAKFGKIIALPPDALNTCFRGGQIETYPFGSLPTF